MPTFRNDGSVAISVKDTTGENVYVEPGKSVQTYKILPSPFVKTSDAPYFSLTKVREAAFSSPGTKTGLLGCSVIRLTAKTTGITIKCNLAANPNEFSLPYNTPIDIKNNGEIESLVFIGSGEVQIEGF